MGKQKMPGIGFVELFVVFLLLLVLFGPKELPEMARRMARFIYEMKNVFQKLEKEWKLKPENPSLEKSKTTCEGAKPAKDS